MEISGINSSNFSITKIESPSENKDKNTKISFKRVEETPIFKTRDDALQNYKKIAQKVNKLVEQGKKTNAIDLLGYRNTIDLDTNNIVIYEDFVPYFSYYNEEKKSQDYITYKEAGIDVNNLSQNLKFVLGEEYDPDETVSEDFNINLYKKYYLPTFEKLEKIVSKRCQKAKEALEQNQDEKALNVLGFKTTTDAQGNITINGDYSNILLKSKDKYFDSKVKKLGDFGINENVLLRNVKSIEGNINFQDTNLTSLPKDLKIGQGITTIDMSSERLKQFFENFYTIEDLSASYDNLDEEIIRYFFKNGFLKPDVNARKQLNRVIYSQYPIFRKDNEEVKKTLEDFSAKKDDILSFKDLCKKYSMMPQIAYNYFKTGKLVPLTLTKPDTQLSSHAKDYYYDLTDETNKENIEEYVRTTLVKGAEEFTKTQLEEACKRNAVRKDAEEEWTHNFRASVLEELGYGSKADIIAQCRLSTGLYKFSEYILNKDSYDISTSQMMTIIDCARNNNPALIKASDLQKKLKGHYPEFIKAIIDNKINVITEDALRLIAGFRFNRYYINLFDEKNLKFFKSIDDENFQSWLSSREKAYTEYKADNEERVEKLKAMRKLSEAKRKVAVNDLIEYENKKIQERKEKIKKEKAMNTSLRTSLAWTYSPKTRAAWRKGFSPEIQEIFDRVKEAEKLNQQLLKGEITAEELEEELKKLTVSKEDKAKLEKFYKGIWTEAGGSGEFKNGQKEAKAAIELYKQSGLDAIKDEKIREKISKWEEKYAQANRVSA